jgi:hypothetical protein
MKLLKSLTAALLISVIPITTCISITGCSTSQKQVAYQSLKTVGLSTRNAMFSLAEGYHKKLVSQEDWDKVKNTYDTKFLPSYNLACDIAAQDFNRMAPADVIALSTYVITTVEQILLKGKK